MVRNQQFLLVQKGILSPDGLAVKKLQAFPKEKIINANM